VFFLFLQSGLLFRLGSVEWEEQFEYLRLNVEIFSAPEVNVFVFGIHASMYRTEKAYTNSPLYFYSRDSDGACYYYYYYYSLIRILFRGIRMFV
jgi:hypothetical protein